MDAFWAVAIPSSIALVSYLSNEYRRKSQERLEVNDRTVGVKDATREWVERQGYVTRNELASEMRNINDKFVYSERIGSDRHQENIRRTEEITKRQDDSALKLDKIMNLLMQRKEPN